MITKDLNMNSIYISNMFETKSNERSFLEVPKEGLIQLYVGHKHSKETKREVGLANKGKKRSEEHKQKISFANIGSKNSNWKGDKVGMCALHSWVKRNKPKSEFCECCKKVNPYDLANISGKYLRDVNDYEWLCRRCHIHKDGRINNLKQYQNRVNIKLDSL